ncbi:MAG: HD-GYP domain-containing protein [Gammaproteobacteria bacterium]|nr:HD-GYP domain-containing protein [Gammaproteobacteria bacterium]
MIKTIAIEQLRVGMYVTALDRSWLDHSLLVTRFLVKDPAMLRKVCDAGIRYVSIDTEKGLDIPPEAPEVSVPQVELPVDAPARALRVAALEERPRAEALFGEATALVKGLMQDARVGNPLDLEQLEPVAERMIGSVLRNPHALLSVCRLKRKDEYTFMHSVSVAALMVAFACLRGQSEDEMRALAKGALLHDVGKVLVPDTILNKPGKLSAQEMARMRAHVNDGATLLRDRNLPDIALDVVTGHHERMDGSGYPEGLAGEAMSQAMRMSAIVDVYDALTSVRVYKDAWEPSFALKKLLEWSPAQFDATLVQQFIRCIGIYPVGSMVELSSGRVGFVVDQGEDIRQPVVRVVYHARHRHYVMPQTIDLSLARDEAIVRVVSPAQFGIPAAEFV